MRVSLNRSSAAVIRAPVLAGRVKYPATPLTAHEAETISHGNNDVMVAGSVFLGLDSPIGPVYLAYGHAEGGNDSVYLFLGQPF